MTQHSVELIIGRLVTDEVFLSRFADSPAALLDELAAGGLRINPCERDALQSLDPAAIRQLAERLDPRIQKCDLRAVPAWRDGICCDHRPEPMEPSAPSAHR